MPPKAIQYTKNNLQNVCFEQWQRRDGNFILSFLENGQSVFVSQLKGIKFQTQTLIRLWILTIWSILFVSQLKRHQISDTDPDKPVNIDNLIYTLLLECESVHDWLVQNTSRSVYAYEIRQVLRTGNQTIVKHDTEMKSWLCSAENR